MKKLFLFLLLVAIAVSLTGFWFYQNTQPVSSNEEFEDFLITRGSGASLIGNNLSKAGLIKNPLAFKVYVQVTGKSGGIQAGEYRLSPSMGLFQLVDQLGKGPSEIWVTIPEGLRREEIALRFATQLEKDEVFINEFLTLTEGKEGRLFPDTYLFPKTISAQAIVTRMENTYEAKIATLTNNTNFSEAQLLALASLIERETKTKEERPVVAGILANRLDIGMALQIDATVQYALASSKYSFPTSTTKWWDPILRSDLQVNSPYNTYKFPSLPPGPIANPGLSSLEAAYNPESSDYLYYMHDSKGNIYYGRTLDEHNANVQKYLNN